MCFVLDVGMYEVTCQVQVKVRQCTRSEIGIKGLAKADELCEILLECSVDSYVFVIDPSEPQ